jgi:hypothetical protein
MASSGSGNRSSSGSRAGSGNKAGSGNRKPAAARAGGSSTGGRNQTAADRARERVQQQGGARPGSRPAATANRGRPPARGGGRRPPQRGGSSTARTVGIFGGTLVVLVAVIIILFSTLSGSGKGGAKNDPYIAPFPAKAAIVNAVEHVPNSELAAAGNATGVVSAVGKKGSGANLVAINAPETSGGKVVITYVGAEYCPYCAATRWALAIALSKFGTLSGLQQTASTPLDVYPSTHTLSFAKVKYSSPYVVFRETEELSNDCAAGSVVANPQGGAPAYVCQNGNYKPLQAPTKAVSALVNKYDSVTYFGSLDSGGAGIPFIDIGGKYIESGALYDPGLLANATWTQIVNAFRAPTQGIGQAILGSANRYIAMICQAAHNKPAVCSQGYVKSAEKAL